MALAVEPFEQDLFSATDIVATPFQVIRYGVIIQVPEHADTGLPEHISLLQYISGVPCPVRELGQALAQLLTAGATFDFEVSLFCFPAVVRESQKGELLGFLASLVRALPSKPPEFDASCFFPPPIPAQTLRAGP